VCSRSPGGRVGRCCPADRNDSWGGGGGEEQQPPSCKLSHATGLACGRDGSTKLPSRCTPFLESSLFCVSSLFTPALCLFLPLLPAPDVSRFAANFCIALRGGPRKIARWSFRVAFGMGFLIYSPFSSFYKSCRAS